MQFSSAAPPAPPRSLKYLRDDWKSGGIYASRPGLPWPNAGGNRGSLDVRAADRDSRAGVLNPKSARTVLGGWSIAWPSIPTSPRRNWLGSLPLRARRAFVLQGIAEGTENSNFLVHTSTGN